MLNSKPKRFQLHLSTLLFASLLLGLLLFLNCRGLLTPQAEHLYITGWPFIVYWPKTASDRMQMGSRESWMGTFEMLVILVNLAICGFIVVGSSVFLEWLKRKKQFPSPLEGEDERSPNSLGRDRGEG